MSNLGAINKLPLHVERAGTNKTGTRAAVKSADNGDPEIKAMLAEVDLPDIVSRDTGEAGRDRGDYIIWRDCPVCHHHDCFSVKIDGNQWYWRCFSSSNRSGYEGGTFLEYLLATGQASDYSEAVAQLRIVTGHPRESHEAGDASKASKAGGRPYLDGKGRVVPDKLSRYMVEHEGACVIDGAPAVWDGEHYAVGHKCWESKVYELAPSATTRDWKEVTAKLQFDAPKRTQSRDTLIAFENGVFDLESGDFRAMTPDDVIVNVIPVKFTPSAECEAVDSMLNHITCGDPTLREDLEEVAGCCMTRSTVNHQVAVLVGPRGRNGKSTYAKMLANLLGASNVCSLDINQLGSKTLPGKLIGKTACICDDVSTETVTANAASVLKRACTGGMLSVDVKYHEGIDFVPTATFVLLANKFPSFAQDDANDALQERLFAIPFRAHFSPSEPNWDPNIGRKLDTPEAAQRLALLGVRALQRMSARDGKFTPNSYGVQMVRDLRLESDSFGAWVEDTYGEHGGDALSGMTVGDAYSAYSNYCWSSGYERERLTRRKFSNRACQEFGLTSRNTRRSGAQVRVFLPKEAQDEQLRRAATQRV